MNHSELHPDVRIGHVHLRVSNLERATAFYRDVLGFAVTAYGPDHGLPGAAPGWRYHELATGHDAMLTAPEELAKMLLELHQEQGAGPEMANGDVAQPKGHQSSKGDR